MPTAKTVLVNMCYAVHRLLDEGVTDENELLNHVSGWSVAAHSRVVIDAAMSADEIRISQAVDAFVNTHPYFDASVFTQNDRQIIARVVSRCCAQIRDEA